MARYLVIIVLVAGCGVTHPQHRAKVTANDKALVPLLSYESWGVQQRAGSIVFVRRHELREVVLYEVLLDGDELTIITDNVCYYRRDIDSEASYYLPQMGDSLTIHLSSVNAVELAQSGFSDILNGMTSRATSAYVAGVKLFSLDDVVLYTGDRFCGPYVRSAGG